MGCTTAPNGHTCQWCVPVPMHPMAAVRRPSHAILQHAISAFTWLRSEVSSLVNPLPTHALMLQAQLENYGLESEAQRNNLTQLKVYKYST